MISTSITWSLLSWFFVQLYDLR